MILTMDWQQISGNWVWVPDNPIAIVHFLGGAFVAAAPHLTYRALLEALGREGYIVIATPFINTLDHAEIAQQVKEGLDRTLEQLYTSSLMRRRYLPVYGLGHSMGCKLHLLIGSLFPVERSGNILLSFNNYAAREAIPLVEDLSQASSGIWSRVSAALSTALPKGPISRPLTDWVAAQPDLVEGIEFTPNPAQTNELIASRYQVRRNLLVKFRDDTIDQTRSLHQLLQSRFPDMVSLCRLSGNHLTPLGQDLVWQAGSAFSPADAIGQWLKQSVYRDLTQLQQEILRWLSPTRF